MRVMTFNLLKEPMAGWRRRADAASCLIRNAVPDLIGTQEGTAPLLDAITAGLSGFARFGRGREVDGRGMQAAIFYRSDRFTVENAGHFWLSRLPDVPGSRPWLSPVPRMATWVRLQDGETGKAFTYVNTHFNHFAGATQAAHMVERLAELPRPLMLSGDFNAWPVGGAHQVFRAWGLRDAWQDCGWRAPWRGWSWHAYTGFPIARIDWIFVSPEVRVSDAWVLRDRPHGVFPSDHFPVMAEIEL